MRACGSEKGLTVPNLSYTINHSMNHTNSTTRMAKSFTIDPDIYDYVVSTKAGQSTSERVNELLRLAMRAEKYEQLEAEAKAFFAGASEKERTETRAFQAASLRTLNRD